MNNLLIYLLIPAIFLGSDAKKPATDVPKKALDAFNINFSNAADLQWFTSKNTVEAVFGSADCKTIVIYNKFGKLLNSTRYYGGDRLPLNIACKIKKAYPNKTIKLVTELIIDNQVIYSLNLEDENCVYVVESDIDGALRLSNKFAKQQM